MIVAATAVAINPPISCLFQLVALGRPYISGISASPPAGPAPVEFGKAFPMYNWNQENMNLVVRDDLDKTRVNCSD
jgi:hypothetical protein